FNPLRITFTADEIMAIYTTPEQGIKAAIAMQKAALEILHSQELGTGFALHCGSVIEGLFGGDGVRTYTVIGDVVNTAKRLEGATPAGEITISDSVYKSINTPIEVEAREPFYAKGKTSPLMAWKLIKL
ncbi:MAG TPA: adenylate/guanylate cyclase domain-containing protein, partial [Allocoleopsis sp.]